MLENYSALSKKLEEKEHYNISQNDELNEIKMKLSQENEVIIK